MQVNSAKALDHNIIILCDKIFEINWIWFDKKKTPKHVCNCKIVRKSVIWNSPFDNGQGLIRERLWRSQLCLIGIKQGERRTIKQSAAVAWDKFHNTPIYATGLQYSPSFVDTAYFRTTISIVSFKNYHIISTKTKHIITSLAMGTKQKEDPLKVTSLRFHSIRFKTSPN